MMINKGLLQKNASKNRTTELYVSARINRGCSSYDILCREQSEETVPDIEGSPSWNSLEDEPEIESTVDKEVKSIRAKL